MFQKRLKFKIGFYVVNKIGRISVFNSENKHSCPITITKLREIFNLDSVDVSSENLLMQHKN